MLSMAKIALLVYLGFGAFLYLVQRSLIYLPVAENSAEGHAVEYLAHDGVQLKLWVVNPGQAQAVVYFGGNAEDVYYNADDFAAALPTHTVYLVNYRGYGGSGGKPSETALFADALALFDHLRDRHAGLAVIGRSLGSGVATYLASRRPVEQLLLVTPPDSAVAVARRLYPIYPVDWLLKDRYDSVRHAARVSVPVLILIAEKDRIIGRQHSERLAAAFTDTHVEMQVIEGVGHNGISGPRAYWRAIRTFLVAAGDG